MEGNLINILEKSFTKMAGRTLIELEEMFTEMKTNKCRSDMGSKYQKR